MSSTSPNGNNQTSAQQQITPPTNPPQTGQQPSSKQAKKPKAPATPSDGLAVVALFVVIGIFAGYFPDYSHTPSIKGLCLVIAYVCYSIGFLGGCFELGKLSKNQFWDSFGIGIVGVFMCLGVNWLADLTNSMYALSLIIRILMILPLSLAAYGVVRGILYLVIKETIPGSQSQPSANVSPQPANPAIKERMKPEQIAGIAIAVLSVVTAAIQALPTLIPLVKQLLHIP
jgi:hypothetical protein